MARREVLVQLDDELVQELDRVADRQGVSRSELLRRGAAAILEADAMAIADARLTAAYRKQPPDAALAEAAHRLAAKFVQEW